MSGTRYAQPDSPFRQERYASSDAFERGLLANLVARRCSVLDDKADRELIWALQYLSHQDGGLKKVASELLEKYAGRFGTEQMVQIGKKAGGRYNAKEVRKIRHDLPFDLRQRFLLRDETKLDVDPAGTRRVEQASYARYLRRAAEDAILNADLPPYERETQERLDRKKAQGNPATYPVNDFVSICLDAATSSDLGNYGKPLCEELSDLCLDPGFAVHDDPPWYFAEWHRVISDYLTDWKARHAAGLVTTSLGAKINEVLDYTLEARILSLIEGDARIGKSFAARKWCELHPGQARFVEVPTGNDETGFFRAMARGLGLGNFQQYKAVEIRERVESVLLTGDILLCLDEASRLWPEVNFRYGFPKRVNWIMSMANSGVPICLVATPQFIERQKTSEKNCDWNSAQLTGRLGHYERLPGDLEKQDLINVARALLPEADTKTLRALAAYARTSARYLAAIEAITKRARYLAKRAGRSEATTADVRRAMQESVIPADSRLVTALNSSRKPAPHQRRRAVAEPMPLDRSAAATSEDTDVEFAGLNRFRSSSPDLLPKQ